MCLFPSSREELSQSVSNKFSYFQLIICLIVLDSSGYQYSTNTFIYSLKNYYGYGYFKKDVNSNYEYATYSYYNYGPTFGGGHDIYVADWAGSNYNSYFYCHCYSYTSPYCDCSMWTGNNNFCPHDLEVYYEVTP